MPETPPPITLEALLARLEELEDTIVKQAAAFEKALAQKDAQIAQKDQIIAGLQKRLFGSKSERLDPAQVELDFPVEAMGKPQAPSEEDGAPGLAPEVADASKPKKTRRAKADLFPRNLTVIVKSVLIPEEVQLDPAAYREIGEEHHDEINCT